MPLKCGKSGALGAMELAEGLIGLPEKVGLLVETCADPLNHVENRTQLLTTMAKP